MARRGRRGTIAAPSSTGKDPPSTPRVAGKQPGHNGEPALPARGGPAPLAHRTPRYTTLPGPATEARPQFRYGELLQRAASHYAPAAVLISPNFEILSMQGPLVDYLEFPPGEPTKNLLSLARRGLRSRIAALAQRATREGAVVTDDAAQVRRNARLVRCLLTARPLSEPQEARGSLLIIFQDRLDAGGDASAPGQESPLLQQLEDELKATREDLQRALEECASANGELLASNREVQSKDAQLKRASDELRRSATYRQAVEHLPVAAILSSDSYLYMNQAAEALTAYREGELQTLAAWFGALFGDRQRTALALYEDLRRRCGRESLTVSLTRKDGLQRAVELSAGFAHGIEIITLHDVTEQRAMQRHVLDIASDEQRRVGQELHDVVLQDLTGLGLLADAARNNVPASGPAQELVNKLVGGLRRLNVKVRALCEGLVPPLEFEVGDLNAALQALAETTSRGHGLRISVEVEPLSGIDPQVTHQLYRIVQEALVDIVRYSQASAVVVRLSERQAEGFRLEISDDGTGGEPRRRAGASGARIIQYRCALLGGQLQILPRPDGGCIVSCTFARSVLTNEPDS